MPPAAERRRSGPSRVAAAGAVATVALVAAMAFVAVDLATEPDPPAVPTPTEALVDAFARSRTATFRATGTFTRSNADGARLDWSVEVVQRPPDRLRRQFGEISGHQGDRALVCPAPVGTGSTTTACGLGRDVLPFDALVAGEVHSFRALVEGDQPLYEVRPAGDGCWRMTRTRFDPRAGFGVETTLCFDPETGAVAEQRTDHGDVQEATVFDDITGDVRDRDLEP